MNLRTVRRALALIWALAFCMVRLVLMRVGGPLTAVQRALWLQSACRGVLRSVGVRCTVSGTPPTHGLVVSNHLSYLDIAVFSSVMPCVFVSKAEIAKWPYFGLAARAGGTIFLDRSSRASAAAAASEIAERLRLPVPVLLFPEGTSTDGSEVLRFHSALFQPAIDEHASVTAAALRYVPDGDLRESEYCWYGDADFLAHLWKLLRAPGFSAEIVFGEPALHSDRRTAALANHESIVEMRAHSVRAVHVHA
ncbi:lysophospholipid acyltransferase family protein [Occallatibacter riparius]|uniref:1-acyl-sn-glycerol-3-phosphate acyltransferase n=1 Tax=Occallatibacter riparius TaxID=1002689 RepID=A0A9J7BHX7_9BACT|nr:lysophospholipid acyltransferase family protein [Occallatibacter riparius]UWZ82319.1 1-acyl-sn-glycerol-3-phosphate acyltransferase [Occallatibacter riparius]